MFYILVVILILIWIVAIAVIYMTTKTPSASESLTPLGFDFYSNYSLPIRVHAKDNEWVTEYSLLHDYNRDDASYTAYFHEKIDDNYLSLEPIISMANDASLIITEDKSFLMIKGNYDYIELESAANITLQGEIDNYFSRLTENKTKDLTDLLNISHFKIMLENNYPVRIGKLCIINRSLLFNIKTKHDIPYPRSKHKNGLACKYKEAVKEGINKKIPKIIHQTFESLIIPHCLTRCVNTWILLNPEYEYRYYTGEDCRDFIAANFDKRVLKAYDTLYPGAYKSDLWRCCVLYKLGGVYADIKLFPNTKLDKLIHDDTELILVKDLEMFSREKVPEIFNAFMACKAGHPLMLRIINMICDNVEKRYMGKDRLSITGPVLVREAIKTFDKDVNWKNGEIDFEGKSQILVLKILPSIFESAIIDNDYNVLIYRRNPYDEDIASSDLIYRSTGKKHYSVLYKEGHVFE